MKQFPCSPRIMMLQKSKLNAATNFLLIYLWLLLGFVKFQKLLDTLKYTDWQDEGVDETGIMDSMLHVLRFFFWLPSIFFWDSLVWMGLFLISNAHSTISYSVAHKHVQRGGFLLLTLLHVFVSLSSLTYFSQTGSTLVWKQALEAFACPNFIKFLLAQTSSLLKASIVPNLFFFILVFSGGANYLLRFLQTETYSILGIFEHHEYQILPVRSPTKQDEDDDKWSRKRRTNCRQESISSYALSDPLQFSRKFGFYLFLIVLFRPKHPWSSLAENEFLSFSLEFGYGLITMKMFQGEHVRSLGEKPCPWSYPDNFVESWNKSNHYSTRVVDLPKIDFKHVFLVVLESVRGDVFPFNPNPAFLSQLDLPFSTDTIRMNADTSVWMMKNSSYQGHYSEKLETPPLKLDVTPFANQLVRNSIVAAEAYAVTSYTIKSLVALLCGIYPLNVNYNMESGFHIHQTCLPELLAKLSNIDLPFAKDEKKADLFSLNSDYKELKLSELDSFFSSELEKKLSDTNRGFISGFFQASDLNFDAQHTTLQQMGFDIFVGKEDIRRWSQGPKDQTNYFGYSDHDILPHLLRFLDHGHSLGKKTFTTLLSSVSHHPWTVPWSHQYMKKKYSQLDSVLNDYVNTIHYTDQFLHDFLRSIKERDMLANSLFIITGDHGVSMGEHSKYGSQMNPYDHAFRVPMILYSENPAFAGAKVQNIPGQWTHLDVVPTVLDLIYDKNLFQDIMTNYSYHGQSMLRTFEDHMTFGLVSPGHAALVVRQRHFKAVFDSHTLLSCKLLATNMKKAVLGEYTSTELLFNLLHDKEEQNSFVPLWRHWKEGDGETRERNQEYEQLFQWFDEAREAAFHFVRRNRMKYKFHFTQ